jgi:hypothetical protein
MATANHRLQLAGIVTAVTLGHLGLLAGGVHHHGHSGAGWQRSVAGVGLPMAMAPASTAIWQARTLHTADVAPPPLLSTKPPPPSSMASGAGAYLPRHQLTAGPRPIEPVVIAYPPEVYHSGKLTSRLAVYIDEHGTVRRVEPLDDALTSPALDAARVAFLAARFQPGERKGQPVRARIEVEVNFEEEL